MMAKESSQRVKAVLTGDGADELFGGYVHRYTRPDARFDRVKRIPFSGLRELNARKPKPPIAWQQVSWLRRPYQLALALTTSGQTLRTWRYLQMLYTFNEREKFSLYTEDWATYLRKSAEFSSTDQFLASFLSSSAPNRLTRWLYLDLHTTLPNEMLAKVDKATMAWGLEARDLFLDYRLVEYTLTIPWRLLATGDEGKRILKRSGSRYLPRQVLYRPKQGFSVPIEAWFRKRLSALLEETLTTREIRLAGVFRPEVVAKILERHRNDPNTDLSQAIFNLVWFELWRCQFSGP